MVSLPEQPAISERAKQVQLLRREKVRALERKGFWMGFGLGILAGMLVFVLVAVVFYFFLIRPLLNAAKG